MNLALSPVVVVQRKNRINMAPFLLKGKAPKMIIWKNHASFLGGKGRPPPTIGQRLLSSRRE
jgi:hypothetical protein